MKTSYSLKEMQEKLLVFGTEKNMNKKSDKNTMFKGSRTMEKKKAILNLMATINGSQYVVGTLRFNAREFSYFFNYPDSYPQFQTNLETGEPTSPLEHITWHDGRIHIKRKDNVAVEIMQFSGPLLVDPPVLTPIFIESFYFTELPCFLNVKEFTPWKGSVSQEILSLDASKGFSIIFFLTPAKHPTSQILMGLQFANIPKGLDHPPVLAQLCDLNHRAGRVQVWEGWDFVIVVTPYTQNTLTPIPIDACRLPNYKNVPAALTDLLCQANGIPKVRS